MEKENGSAAHISAFTEVDQLFWVIGSKNSHKIIADTKFQAITQDTWKNDASYRFGAQGDYAQNIIYLWRQIWDTLTKENQAAIKKSMTQDGLTFVGEAVFKDDQHLKRYFKDDHPSQGDIWFFAMTQPASLEEGLLAKTPQKGLDLFKQYGLKHAPMFESVNINPSDFSFENGQTTITSQAYSDLVKKIAQMQNSEGVALYMTLVDKQDTEKTIDLKKCKAADYTLMRKVREHVVNGWHLAPGVISDKLDNSINEFEKAQQEVLQNVLAQKKAHYEALATFFKESGILVYTTGKKGKKSIEAARGEAIRSQWVSIEEQLKDPNKKHVKLKVGEEELYFPKPSTTQ